MSNNNIKQPTNVSSHNDPIIQQEVDDLEPQDAFPGHQETDYGDLMPTIKHNEVSLIGQEIKYRLLAFAFQWKELMEAVFQDLLAREI